MNKFYRAYAIIFIYNVVMYLPSCAASHPTMERSNQVRRTKLGLTLEKPVCC